LKRRLLYFILNSKMRRILLSAAVCLLFTASLRAQNFLNDVTVAVGAGFTFPPGRTADHTKMGYNFVASGGPRFNPHLSLTVDFSLHYLDIKNSLVDPETGVDLSLGSIMRVWSLTLNPAYEFIKQERFSSYATGGYGLYNRQLQLASTGPVPAAACDSFWNVCVSNSPGIVTGNLSPYKAGYNVGGGVTFGAHLKFFVEARYHHMFTKNAATEIVPLTFGLRW
jgi:Outer membrane protein beta-barrel domain